MSKKILTTRDVPRHEVDDRAGPGGGSIMTGRPPGLSKDDFIAKFGTEGEKDEVCRAIVERRSKLPRWIYQTCPECAWKSKRPFGDSDVRKSERPDYCFSCNRPGYVDGAVMRPMKAAEIVAFEKEVAEKAAKTKEREFRAAFFNENHRRAGLGLSPFTQAEFRERQKVEWLAMAGKGGKK